MSKNRVTHTILAAAFLLIAAIIVMLGIHSTNTYAADIEIPEDETVLYSEQSVPVPQDVTQADYDYMEDTYNIHPDGTPVIESKTEENATVVTKTENGTKTRTKKTTTWVVRDTDAKQSNQPSANVTAPDITTVPATPTPTTTPSTNDSTSLALTVSAVALATPVVVAALPAIAIAAPAVIAVAVPAIIAGSLLSGNSSSNSTAATSNNSSSQTSQNSQSGFFGLNLLG